MQLYNSYKAFFNPVLSMETDRAKLNFVLLSICKKHEQKIIIPQNTKKIK